MERISAVIFVRNLGHLIMQTWWLLPQAMEFMAALANSTRRQPFLLEADSINFEDVLGRRATLRFADFKHWPVGLIPIQDPSAAPFDR